jgi:hypothetical protein
LGGAISKPKRRGPLGARLLRRGEERRGDEQLSFGAPHQISTPYAPKGRSVRGSTGRVYLLGGAISKLKREELWERYVK